MDGYVQILLSFAQDIIYELSLTAIEYTHEDISSPLFRRLQYSMTFCKLLLY